MHKCWNDVSFRSHDFLCFLSSHSFYFSGDSVKEAETNSGSVLKLLKQAPGWKMLRSSLVFQLLLEFRRKKFLACLDRGG